VSISLSCDVEPLAAVLQALEQGTPYLFVDDLSIYRNPVAAQQDSAAPLEVQFTLSGYVRPARNAPAPSRRSPDATGAAP
jgi:general secretion pathway protein M